MRWQSSRLSTQITRRTIARLGVEVERYSAEDFTDASSAAVVVVGGFLHAGEPPSVYVPEENRAAVRNPIVAVVLRDEVTMAEREPTRRGTPRGPAPIPVELVQGAVQRHVERRFGRRRLAEAVPRITEYQAGQILGWYQSASPVAHGLTSTGG
jgi:hypothetical protein